MLKRHFVTTPMALAQVAIFDPSLTQTVTLRKTASCPTAMRVMTLRRIEKGGMVPRVILTMESTL
jgi:hypothetical protein